MPEVSAVCDRVLIINKGKIVASGTPDELSKKLSYSNNLMLRIKGRAHDILNALKKLENIEKIKEQGVREPGTVDVLVEAKKGVDIRESLFRLMSASGLPILMMKSMDLSLEEVFLQVTTQEEGGNVK